MFGTDSFLYLDLRFFVTQNLPVMPDEILAWELGCTKCDFFSE